MTIQRCKICNGLLWGTPQHTSDFYCEGHTQPLAEPVIINRAVYPCPQCQEKDKELQLQIKLKEGYMNYICEREKRIKELEEGLHKLDEYLNQNMLAPASVLTKQLLNKTKPNE